MEDKDEKIVMIVILIGLLIGFISTTGSKSQNVRIMDIFLIGPIMIYLGFDGFSHTQNKLNLLLIFFGSSTITYNLRNYLSY